MGVNTKDEPLSPFKSLLIRGCAYTIDIVCCFGIYLVVQLPLMAVRPYLGIELTWFESGLNTELYTLATISFPVWLYFALMESSRWQATIGKLCVGLKVSDRFENGRMRFGPAMVRTIIKLLPWELIHIGVNLPVPLMFVEEPGFRIAFLFAGLLMPAYVLMIAMNKNRRGPHDLFSGSTVYKRAIKNDSAESGE